MTGGSAEAEAFAGHHHDIGFVQQASGAQFTVQPSGAHVHHQEHAALRHTHVGVWAAFKGTHHRFGASAQAGAESFHFRVVARECFRERVFQKRLRAKQYGLSHGQQPGHGRFGRRHPARTEAWQQMRYRDGRNGQRAFAQLGPVEGRPEAATEGEVRIDLVLQDPKVVAFAHGADGIYFCFGKHGTRRVARCIQ